MDLLSELLKKILYIIPVILIVAFLFIFLRFTFKALGIVPAIKSYTSKDFLPPPKQLGSIGSKVPTPTDTPTNKTMEELNPWMKDGSYNYNGNTVEYTQANSQVRDIKIGNNNSISSGSYVSGTAREIFFSNGKFLILLVNKQGQVIAGTTALANKSNTEGLWIPWQARFSTIPPQQSNSCTLVLQNQNNTNDSNLSKVIRIPVECR